MEALVDHCMGNLHFLNDPEPSSEKMTGMKPECAKPSPVNIALEDASQDEIALMLANELEVGTERP